jgi:hypothetical protein
MPKTTAVAEWADVADVAPELITWLRKRRRDALCALEACPGATPDYWRWQGHAELARQLLELLGDGATQ